MTILFMPIDIDLAGLKFSNQSDGHRITAFNPYWTTTRVQESVADETGLTQVLEQLPFDRITIVTHKVQERTVGAHIDVYPNMTFENKEYENICDNEPAGYRILLKGNLDKLEVFNGKSWITAPVPSSPGCYILNSTRAVHRVQDDPGREIIYVRGFLNLEKHRELLSRSYNKFKDNVIRLL